MDEICTVCLVPLGPMIWNDPVPMPAPPLRVESSVELVTYCRAIREPVMVLDATPAGAVESPSASAPAPDTMNAPVHVANDGRVVWANDLGIYGNCVVVDHGYALQSIYGHMNRIDVKVGDMVKKNQSLGVAGATGMAGGVHVHFSMQIDGVQVNAINPGPVRTARLAAQLKDVSEETFLKEHRIARIGEPEDIAAMVAFVLSPHGRLLQGSLIDMDGGSTKTI